MRWWAALWLCWAAIGVAHADWYEATGPNVRVFAEGQAENARQLAERLERLDAAMRIVRSVPPGDRGAAGRLNVYILRGGIDAIERLARQDSVAGFYRASARGSMAFVPGRAGIGRRGDLSAEIVLFHEYTHHFMFRNFDAAYPAWLAEGYAEFHSTARFEEDGSVTFGLPANHRAWEVLSGERVTLDRLLNPESTKLPMSAIYGRGWLLTHYLHFADARKGQLGAYIRSINAGRKGVEAAAAAFGDLKALDRELDRYAGQKLTGLRVPASVIRAGAVTVRTMSAAESAAMPIHIVSTHGVTAEEARKLLPKARRAIAPHPTDAFAQGVLAEAEFDAGNVAEAGAAADRALAADPTSRQGLIYRSMALAAQAEARKDKSAATLKAIRAPLFAANRRDPDDPLPMLMLYQSYAATVGAIPETARKAIVYAQTLAPEAEELRMLAAVEQVAAGDAEAARALVAPLAFNAHGGAGKQIKALMAAIDAKDAAAARKALAGESDAEVE
ncbi:hypothetical protein COC42_08055 [Sphingomonas spermidinifaciens]|uniref:DUF1570 domain-containing protein n=1 Tax=Sphingomonas spermidinifaciens TaxID=1141889 RepID=A0A2A4B8W4_9SPHN|nr:hypothetical protein [Sphingomonas spermidinifaciens]PCD04229.1 hypothetical protein COC42_08055 [Sphingomonas spermidinifaciens]